MKRLATIILALVMMIFTAPNKITNKPHVFAKKTATNGDNGTSEASLPEESETTAETAFGGEAEGFENTEKAKKHRKPRAGQCQRNL